MAIVELGMKAGELARLMDDGGYQAALVKDLNRYVGIVSFSDLEGLLKQNPGFAERALSSLSGILAPLLREQSTALAVRRLLIGHGLDVAPFVDERGQLARVLSREEAFKLHVHENPVVIMAGGFGVRLRPITEHIPKPMIPLMNSKLLDRILNHLIDCGFARFYVAVHYLREQIIDYLGDGSSRGIQVDYLVEDIPKGTAGSLRGLMGRESLPLIVVNGDVVTNQHFSEVLHFHEQQRDLLTVVCKEDWVDISYGVVDCNGDNDLVSITEKPRLSYLINTGMYVLEQQVLELVPDHPCSMTDLINRVREDEGRVGVFRTAEYWQDVGTIDCYAQVIKDINTGMVRSFPPIQRGG